MVGYLPHMAFVVFINSVSSKIYQLMRLGL